MAVDGVQGWNRCSGRRRVSPSPTFKTKGVHIMDKTKIEKTRIEVVAGGNNSARVFVDGKEIRGVMWVRFERPDREEAPTLELGITLGDFVELEIK